MSLNYIPVSDVKFHAPPARWKQSDGTYLICGIFPMETYTPGRLKALDKEYERRMEEHRDRMKQLKSESWVVESKRDAGKRYEVTRKKDGMWECTCPGYMYRKNCSHIEKIKNQIGETK